MSTVAAKRLNARWGPELKSYLTSTADRQNSLSERFSTPQKSTSWPRNGVISLDTLEALMIEGENMCKVENYTPGNRALPLLFSSMKNYLKETGGKLFSRYYGFLCVKNILRTISVGILMETDDWRSFIDGFKPESNREEVLWSIKEATLHHMFQAIKASPYEPLAYVMLLGVKRSRTNAFPSVGGMSSDNVFDLLLTLWRDRKTFFLLCGRELLFEGVLPTLFALCHLMTMSSIAGKNKQWPVLMDILMRYFLVAPEIEKIHLRGLILIANREIKNLGLSGSPTTDQEDAAAIVQAYVHLLTPPLSKYITAHVDLDVASILTDYVACVSQVNLERTTDISRCALERLWAEFDEEERNPIPRERLESKRKLMGAMLISVRLLQKAIKDDFEARIKFAKMLDEMDAIELGGRALLLVTREDSSTAELVDLDPLMGGLADLSYSLQRSIEECPSIYPRVVASWGKVMNQFTTLLELSLPNIPLTPVFKALQIWGHVGGMLGASEKMRMPPECAYPRCPKPFTNEMSTGVRFVCGLCYMTAYCGEVCQHAHWNSQAVDSHRADCLLAGDEEDPLLTQVETSDSESD